MFGSYNYRPPPSAHLRPGSGSQDQSVTLFLYYCIFAIYSLYATYIIKIHHEVQCLFFYLFYGLIMLITSKNGDDVMALLVKELQIRR